MNEPEYQIQYRNVWMEYCECLSEPRRKELEQLMDKAQDNFTWNEFQDFKITLPGFIEFWNSLASRALGGIHAGQINVATDQTTISSTTRCG